MRTHLNFSRFFGVFVVAFLLSIFLLPDYAEARRGSFGGSRSFGRSRSFSTPKRTSTPKPRSSFGTNRSTTNAPRSSFGGSRMTKAQAQAKYGTPRKVETRSFRDANGVAQNYNVHHYNGFGSSFMTGYLMGSTPFMWMTPFHPAFYFSRPVYVQNANGTIDVYPPTFSFFKLLIGLVVLGVIVLIIRALIKRARGRSSIGSQSSFS